MAVERPYHCVKLRLDHGKCRVATWVVMLGVLEHLWDCKIVNQVQVFTVKEKL